VPHFIRHPKDFWSGVMFLFFGLAAVVIGQDYPMGTAGRMGPAYFPVVLGALLALIGVVAVLRSLWVRGEAMEKFALHDMFVVLLSVVLFGFLVRGAGMVVAVVVLVLTSAYASANFKWKASLVLAAGAALFSVTVFVKALGLPLPVFGPWFGA
jgi:hypothetical protein